MREDRLSLNLVGSSWPPGCCWRFASRVDIAGLRIAVNATAAAMTQQLPPLRPAAALYQWLLTHGVPRADKSNIGASDLGTLLAWLPDGLGEPTARLLRERHRIPQETLGLRALRANPALLSHAVN